MLIKEKYPDMAFRMFIGMENKSLPLSLTQETPRATT